MGVGPDDGDTGGGDVGMNVHLVADFLEVRLPQENAGGGVTQAKRVNRVEEAEEDEAEDIGNEGGHVCARVDAEWVEPAGQGVGTGRGEVVR